VTASGQKQSLRSAAADRFARPDVAELTIELATQERSAVGEPDECSATRGVAGPDLPPVTVVDAAVAAIN